MKIATLVCLLQYSSTMTIHASHIKRIGNTNDDDASFPQWATVYTQSLGSPEGDKCADAGTPCSCLNELVYHGACSSGGGAPASNFIGAGSKHHLLASGIHRVDYVSNLRRAIDTWSIGLSVDHHAAIMTSDIQEISFASDSSTNIGSSSSAHGNLPEWCSKNGVVVRPWVGERQLCEIGRLIGMFCSFIFASSIGSYYIIVVYYIYG